MPVILKKKKKGIKMSEMIICFVFLPPGATWSTGALAGVLHCQRAAPRAPIASDIIQESYSPKVTEYPYTCTVLLCKIICCKMPRRRE